MPPENNITFEENRFKIRPGIVSVENIKENPFIVRLLLKLKIVKTEKQAIAVILVITALFIIISIFFVNKAITVPQANINPGLIEVVK